MTDKLIQIGGVLVRGIDTSGADYLIGVSSIGVRSTAAATIASGGSLSGAVDIGDNVVVGIVIPAAWTVAVITFDASIDGTTYGPLYDRYGTEYTVQVAAARAIPLSIQDFVGFRYLKIRSGTSGTPVNQGAERVISIVMRPV